ncbi:MAG: hypothetical protein GVY14_01330 [Spirochaetes bacterium]|nr:hypothetical protein [Spirochaetota bacterium]
MDVRTVKDETTVPEVTNLFKQVMDEPERMFEMHEIDIKRQAERAVIERYPVHVSGSVIAKVPQKRK